MNTDPKLTFWNGILAGIVGLATMVAIWTWLLPDQSLPIALCVGWGVFLGLWLYLSRVLQSSSPAIEHVVMAILSVQLLVMGALSPWFGWTTETVRSWFGRFFFAIYVVGPISLILLMSAWRHFQKGSGRSAPAKRTSSCN